MSISVIRPSLMANPMIEIGSPARVTTAPAALLTSTGRTEAPGWLNIVARPATSAAPRSSAETSRRESPPSARSTASGWRTATRAARSPLRAAAKKARTIGR
jgi:hypothetical protein